jgi:hypothetical protein
VKNVCSVHSDALPAFDSTLCPLVRDILDQDVVEFGPYGFQLLAQLLDLHRVTGAPIPPDYLAILPPLFMPVFWERPGYVPALTPLIIGYMYTAAADIVSKGQVRDIVALRIFASASTSTCSLICLSVFLSSCLRSICALIYTLHAGLTTSSAVTCNVRVARCNPFSASSKSLSRPKQMTIMVLLS